MVVEIVAISKSKVILHRDALMHKHCGQMFLEVLGHVTFANAEETGFSRVLMWF
jgi:hypothetical protein